MASKPKTKSYYVIRRGLCYHGYYTKLAGYEVGARNEKEAMELVKAIAGKHVKLRAYLHLHRKPLPHGEVIEDFNKQESFLLAKEEKRSRAHAGK